MKKVRPLLIAIILTVVLLVLFKFALLVSLKHFFYPSATEMPQVVDASVEELLDELEDALKAKVPRALEALQAGLSSEEIARIERNGGFRLPDDIKALYRWRNGSRFFYNDNETPAYDGPIPGHRFLPLDEAVDIRTIVKKQAGEAPLFSRLFWRFIIPTSHKESWIPLFDDGCGDGYFYDPSRKASEGSLFYNFAEQGDFVFFPSMKNLLAAIIECFKAGAFVLVEDKEGPYWEQNYELSKDIWSKFGERVRN